MTFTLTRTAVEQVLVNRLGSRLTAAGLDGTTTDGNEALNDALWLALDTLGYAVADITLVADSDLSPVTAADVAQLLDVAEVRTLETIQGNLALVDFSADGASYSLGQLSSQVDKLLTTKRKALQDRYGIGLGTLSAGVLSYDFQGNMPSSSSDWYPFN